MITRKAAVGFLLIAIIVFPIAYVSWVAPMPKTTTATIDMKQFTHRDDSITTDTIYHPPIAQFASPLHMATAMTGIMELFTLICYFGLKRIEPLVKAWEIAERERLKQESE